MLILHPKFPILPPISAKITRNHTGFFRFIECGMPDLRRKTEGAPFKDCSQNHTKCDRNVYRSKGYMIFTKHLCILYYCHAYSWIKEVLGINYVIRHYDTPLLRFSATEETGALWHIIQLQKNRTVYTGRSGRDNRTDIKLYWCDEENQKEVWLKNDNEVQWFSCTSCIYSSAPYW